MDKETKDYCKKHDVLAQYKAGFNAQRDGLSVDESPYANELVDNAKREAWQFGYEDAENDTGE